MSDKPHRPQAGEELVKQQLITREELDAAREHEAKSGTPWYKQLVQVGKINFGSLEDVLYYEFHPKSVRVEQQTLGDTLLQDGRLTQEQLEKALTEQKRTGRLLGDILVDLGFVTAKVKAQFLAQQYGIEYADLESAISTPEALVAVPESIARKHGLIPLSVDGDRINALITDPQSLGRLKNVSVLLGKRIHPILTAVEDMNGEIRCRYRGADATDEGEGRSKKVIQLDEAIDGKALEAQYTQDHGAASKEIAVPVAQESETTSEEETYEYEEVEEEDVLENDDVEYTEKYSSDRFEEIAQQASGASVVKMVSTIIEGAINSGATDVHLDPQEPEMRVRYRIDGVLHDVMSIPGTMEMSIISRIKIISDLDITNTRLPQDGHISMEVGEGEFDIRVATLPCYLGERVVMRILDQANVLQGIKDLGMEADDEKTFIRVIEQPYGMILVTGPTGSGKTTTLYASLNQKDVMTDSIVTLEDPVEYQLSGVNQVQIDTDIDLTFANTLRASLRQDIDVLLVGEIRDAETARIAIRASMTGHLVFSTLHTNDAPEAISTLRNMDIPSFLISSALTAVVGQRLVRTICTECKKSYKPAAAMLKSINLPASTKKLYRGEGCETCYSTGNKGRTGIFEILEVNAAIRNLIAEDASVADLTKKSKLKTMAMRCREKVKNGDVTAEEFLRVIRT